MSVKDANLAGSPAISVQSGRDNALLRYFGRFDEGEVIRWAFRGLLAGAVGVLVFDFQDLWGNQPLFSSEPTSHLAAPAVPATTAAVNAAPALPNFFGGAAPVEASLASHCNSVNLVTSTNGGYITADTLTDPAAALGEQLCLTRTYAIAAGETLMSQVAESSPQQIAEQCGTFGALLKEQVASVSLQPRDQVLASVGQFVLSTGMTPAQLEKTAQICLASGYKTDDMGTAMGAALMLVALGKGPYAELLGHHLSQGFGASQRSDLAVSWYDQALTALAAGAPPVFGPGQPERAGLLRKASMMLGGNSGLAGQDMPKVTQASAVPVFKLAD